jgi:hypothetical protein
MSTAFVVAHPAHELKVLSWYRETKPTVSVLTTGSRDGQDLRRLNRSRDLATEAGVPIGPIFGEVLDREFYQSVLDGDTVRFHEWTTRLRRCFRDNDVTRVVCDGWQFYNVAHDLTHVIARVAAAEAAEDLGRPIEVLELLTADAADGVRIGSGAPVVRRVLTREELIIKWSLILSYPDIAEEVQELSAKGTWDTLGEEVLFRPPQIGQLFIEPNHKPAYEHFGEGRVNSGTYRQTIRWHHVSRIVDSLLDRLSFSAGDRVRAA